MKEINKLSKQRDEIYAELQEIDSHMITLEGAKKHFESYFNATSKFETANTTNNKTDDDKKSYTEIPENENLELN